MPIARTDRTQGQRYRREPIFDCDGPCKVLGAKSGTFDDDERAARHCCREDFDTNKWTGTQLVTIRLGAPPDYETDNPEPDEDIVNNGCPAAWWDGCRFFSEIVRYRRAMDSNGGRVDHHRYTHCDDPFIWDCVRILEAEEAAAEAALQESISR